MMTVLLQLTMIGSTVLVAASGWFFGRGLTVHGLIAGALGAGWLGIIYAGLLSTIRDFAHKSLDD